MPVIAEYLSNPQFAHWKIMHLEQEILQSMDHPELIVCSGTYLPLETLAGVVEQVKSSDHLHAVLVGLMDPVTIELEDHPRLHRISSEQLWLWLVATQRNFKKYTLSQLEPQAEFRWKFLCYQNKITPPREYLYDTLDALNSGIVTLSGRGVRKFNRVLDDSCGLPETFLHQPVPPEEHMPNDIWSLGNPEIWQECFLNVVSETTQPFDPGTENVFLSEKTVKPLIGMRPFLHYGSPRMSELLRDRGFETFEEDFGYNPGDCHQDQAHQLRDIITSIDNPEALYKKLHAKILHNRNHFETACAAEWQGLQEIIAELHSQITTT